MKHVKKIKKEKKKKEQSINELWDSLNQSNIHVTGSPQGTGDWAGVGVG